MAIEVLGGQRPGAEADSAAPPRWSDVLRWAKNGNPDPPRRVERSEQDWRARLSEAQFQVTRMKGTERPYSSEMCGLFEPGRYQCVCCDTPLFDATTKFESHSGWPSFTAPLAPGVVAYHLDSSHGMERIEAICQVCDAHLGHVFPDGPEPTGLRYCINAVSLTKAANG
ncbi:MAG: peptide-methionine (R)-S-oxide reductase MsrB [Gemmatimonadales bacterium]